MKRRTALLQGFASIGEGMASIVGGLFPPPPRRRQRSVESSLELAFRQVDASIARVARQVDEAIEQVRREGG